MPHLTDEQLADLERDYAPADQQKCRVCQAGLEFAATMDSLTRYVCTSPDASVLQHGIGDPGWAKALEHAAASEWYDQRKADSRIVALVQEAREARLPVQERMDLLQVDTAQEVLRQVLAAVAGTVVSKYYINDLREALGPLFQQWDMQA